MCFLIIAIIFGITQDIPELFFYPILLLFVLVLIALLTPVREIDNKIEYTNFTKFKTDTEVIIYTDGKRYDYNTAEVYNKFNKIVSVNINTRGNVFKCNKISTLDKINYSKDTNSPPPIYLDKIESK